MAGKALAIRTLTAVVFAAVMVVGFIWPLAYAVLFSLISTALCIEYFNLAIPAGKYAKERFCVILSVVSLFVLLFCTRQCGLRPSFVALAFLPAFLAMIYMLFDCTEKYNCDTALFFPLLYLAVPVSSSLWIAFDGNGPFNGMLLLAIFILVWANDIGAYAYGMSFGQKEGSRKLFPSLSPKKSWIGAVGGVLTSMAVAVLERWLLMPGTSLAHWLILAFTVSVAGIFGDLFESLLKRRAGVKDSGNMLPGHGGMLDRFDAALFALPAAAAYIELTSFLQ
ncbi:MAG: CDP-archaeol synthase [Bacteroidales bacterium]|nr:CDP-archaeol synthase [Candidatus Cacconaster merdequi]